MLQAEILRHNGARGESWARVLQPIADVFVTRFLDCLPKCTYPIRVGTHYNSAFALVLALEYAGTSKNAALEALLKERAIHWFTNDVNAQAWEPRGDAFLSSTLIARNLCAACAACARGRQRNAVAKA